MRFDEPAGRAERLREAVAAAAVELTSADHAVTVVVGPAGAVRGLTLNQRAFRYDGAALGELIVRTSYAAATAGGTDMDGDDITAALSDK